MQSSWIIFVNHVVFPAFFFTFATGYVIVLGDFSFALAQKFGFAAWTSKEECMAALVVCICWPLSCAPSLGFLRHNIWWQDLKWNRSRFFFFVVSVDSVCIRMICNIIIYIHIYIE